MNQHYVPRVYLKNFSKKSGNDFLVDVYDITTKYIFNTNIKNICAEKDFYTLELKGTLNRDRLVVEKFYSEQIEPLYEKAYNILTNDRISIISNHIRMEILFGIFQLYARNPQILKISLENHKRIIENLHDEAISRNTLAITYLDDYFNLKEWTKEKIIQYISEKVTTHFKERHLIGTKEVFDFHKNSILEVEKIRDNAFFITSDNPLTFNDITTRNNHPLLKTKEFTIPLNPKYALRIFHDNTMKINQIYRTFIPNGSANSINSEIEEHCSRFLIGSKRAFTDYFAMKKIMESTSIDLQMSALKQILEIFPKTPKNKDEIELIHFYVSKYQKQGNLDKHDQIDLHKKLLQLAIINKKKKI